MGANKEMPERKTNSRNNNKKRSNGGDEDFNPKFRKVRKKVCVMCSNKNMVLDYKNGDQLKKFINEKGKILPRRATGACAKHQRDITQTIKRARHIAVLPFTED